MTTKEIKMLYEHTKIDSILIYGDLGDWRLDIEIFKNFSSVTTARGEIRSFNTFESALKFCRNYCEDYDIAIRLERPNYMSR